MDYVATYYRDNKKLSFEEFHKRFDEDLEKENEKFAWDIKYAAYSDYGEGRDCYFNGHEYKVRVDQVYDTAKELLEDMVSDGAGYELINAIKSFSEEEAEGLIKYIDRVKRDKQKFILKDSKDYPID